MKRDTEKFKEFVKWLKPYILKNWGKRCIEYEMTCLLCQVWRTYDQVKSMAWHLKDLDKLK